MHPSNHVYTHINIDIFIFLYAHPFPSLRAVFKKDLEKDVAGDTSGDVTKLLLALVQVKTKTFLFYNCYSCYIIIAYTTLFLYIFLHYYRFIES